MRRGARRGARRTARRTTRRTVRRTRRRRRRRRVLVGGAIVLAASGAYAANLIAHEICCFTGIQGMQGLVRMLDHHSPFEQILLDDIVGTVADTYIDHTKMLELNAVRIPEYILWFTPVTTKNTPIKWQQALPEINQRINPFLYELRACFKTRTFQTRS